MRDDPTAVGLDGKKYPELSQTADQAGGENPDDAEAALADLESGAPIHRPSSNASKIEDGAVQAYGAAVAPEVSPANVLSELGGGRPLEAPVRTRMESALGHDFSRVRVHADGVGNNLARSFGAHAFTVGEHLALASGRYQPTETQGHRLLAHELTHVVQQRRGLSGAVLKQGFGQPGDAYEREAEATADRVASRASSTEHVTPTQAPASSGPPAIQAFSGSAAAAYAKKWALGTNTAYRRFGNDCTNFVSQAMEAGGWTYKLGSGDKCDDYDESSVRWYQVDGCERWWPRANVDAS